MTRSIDQIKDIFLSVPGAVFHMNSLAFDRDTPLTFQLHAVKDLFHHFALFKNAGFFKNPVSQCAFSVVDMGYNAEISYLVHFDGHGSLQGYFTLWPSLFSVPRKRRLIFA